MKFTIFSSFYNNVEHLFQVWEGIRNQTHTNWEWIISDDFSDDPKSEQILKDFADSTPKVKYIKPRWKKELFFNPPVEISTGKIMLVQDVDDYPHPKLLEVYEYNFHKFPDVELISCSSMICKENIKGKIEWYKNNHYKGIYNQKEAQKMLRSLGDARAYRIRSRIPNEFVKEGEFNYGFTDELYKSCIIETRGKLLFIPRILHTYSQNSPTSISHKKRLPSYQENAKEENKNFINDIYSKINLEELDSREHYYDECYEVWIGMLLSDHYHSSKPFKLDIYNSELNPRSRNRIKELYFDYDIKYNHFRKDSDYVFFKISQEDDLKYIKDNFDFYYKNNKKITICCNSSKLQSQVLNITKLTGWYFNWDGNYNIVFNHKFNF
tara:strand:+ start:794 stop:1936 length:1143 start_codon:yes stop_codon:yes gene_type:complete